MAYDDNLYQNPGPSLAGELGQLGFYFGVEVGHNLTTTKLAGEAIGGARRYTPGGWWKDRHRRKAATSASQDIWRSFTAGKGRKFGARWQSAKAAAGAGKYQQYKTANIFGTSVRGRAAATRGALGRSTGRAIAGLARPVLGVANAYLLWGTLAQAGIETAAAGIGELRRFGKRLRSKVPESSIGWRDMAVREQAFTMRQASLMAIHMSQSGVRMALGNEASALH